MKKRILYMLIPIIVFLGYISIRFVPLDKTGKFEYADSLNQAEHNNTLIRKYLIFNDKLELIDTAWSVYGTTSDIFGTKRIEQEKKLLRLKDRFIRDADKTYFKASYKGDKLTCFYNKNLISIIGVKESMDTIVLKAYKENYYVVSFP